MPLRDHEALGNRFRYVKAEGQCDGHDRMGRGHMQGENEGHDFNH